MNQAYFKKRVRVIRVNLKNTRQTGVFFALIRQPAAGILAAASGSILVWIGNNLEVNL
jgi:hypothetical protein